MSRLQSEIERLYGTPPGDGSVRGLVLELARPAEWPPMARLCARRATPVWACRRR